MRKYALLQKTFAVLLAAFVLLSALSAFMLTGFASSAPPSFSTDFTQTDELAKWTGDTSSFSAADSKLTSTEAWKAIAFTNGTDTAVAYENVRLDVTLSQTARIAFRASNLWTDRHYVEVDFGGAVMLRNSGDADVNTAAVTGLAAGTNADISIKIVGNQVTVSVNGTAAIDASAPDIAAQGFAGLIVPAAGVSFDKFSITPLDADGNPIKNESSTVGGNESDSSGDEAADDLKPVIPEAEISHYFTDFDSETQFQNTWTGITEFELENGKLVAQNAVAGALLDAVEYQNFEIETVLNNDARLVFRADDMVIWTANRFYVEVDFAASGNSAVFFRDQTDQNLKVVELPEGTLTPGTPVRLRLKVVGTKVQVFLGKNTQPAAEYDGLTERSGYAGLMVINLPTAFDYYKITELDSSGTPVKAASGTGSVPSASSRPSEPSGIVDEGSGNGPADTGMSASGMFVLCLIAASLSAAAVIIMANKKQSAE